jgi:hypothetical protein
MAKKLVRRALPPGASGCVAARARLVPRLASRPRPSFFFTQNPNTLPRLDACPAATPSAPRSLGKRLPPAPLPPPVAGCPQRCLLARLPTAPPPFPSLHPPPSRVSSSQRPRLSSSSAVPRLLRALLRRRRSWGHRIVVTEVAADSAAAPIRHSRSPAPWPRSPRRPPMPLPLATASPTTAALDAATAAHGRCGDQPSTPQASFWGDFFNSLHEIDWSVLFVSDPLFIALISLGLIQSIRDIIPCTSMQ